MNRKSLKAYFILSIIMAICLSCQNNDKPNLTTLDKTPREFESFYPGDITNVSSIEILSGDGGERKTINDKSVIKEWLEKIRHVQVVPEPDQEDYTGFLYVFTLYEHGEEMLTFSPLIINGIKVESSDEIVSLMHELYFLESNRAA